MNRKSKLFKLPFAGMPKHNHALVANTPLGSVTVEATNLCTEPPDEIGVISNTAQIYIWDKTDYQLEILKALHEPVLPEGMHVDGCVIFLCKFKNLSKQLSPEFTCRLNLHEEPLEAEPESGEGLIAESWQNAHTRLTIGTEDEEYLHGRANHQKGLPKRFAKEELISSDSIDYLSDGIKLSLPPFHENEEGQIQFVVAWTKTSKPAEASTWFAVDVNSDDILQIVTHR